MASNNNNVTSEPTNCGVEDEGQLLTSWVQSFWAAQDADVIEKDALSKYAKFIMSQHKYSTHEEYEANSDQVKEEFWSRVKNKELFETYKYVRIEKLSAVDLEKKKELELLRKKVTRRLEKMFCALGNELFEDYYMKKAEKEKVYKKVKKEAKKKSEPKAEKKSNKSSAKDESTDKDDSDDEEWDIEQSSNSAACASCDPLEVYYPPDSIGVEIVNKYKELPEHLKPKVHNPAFVIHDLELPFRMLVVAPSGTGKTNFIINLIDIFNKGGELDTFNTITIVTAKMDEPLYQKLKLDRPNVEILEGIENVPDVNDFNKHQQNLVIFDDLVLEKNQGSIAQFYNRGRKQNISSIYLSQRYSETPKMVRINVNYVALLKLHADEEQRVLSKFSFGREKSLLNQMYHESVNEKFGVFMVHIEKQQHRKGFKGQFPKANPNLVRQEPKDLMEVFNKTHQEMRQLEPALLQLMKASEAPQNTTVAYVHLTDEQIKQVVGGLQAKGNIGFKLSDGTVIHVAVFSPADESISS